MNQQTSAPRQVKTGNLDDVEYDSWLRKMQANFDKTTAKQPLFQTTASGMDLWNMFLGYLPADEVQYHTCSACRHFVTHFGGLVTIDKKGIAHSAIWQPADAPALYRAPLTVMANYVKQAKITGPFLTNHAMMGTPVTGIWRHFGYETPASLIYKAPLMNAHQRVAQVVEEQRLLREAVRTYSPEVVAQALNLIRSGTLYRDEHVEAIAVWFADVLDQLGKIRDPERHTNLLMLYASQAPVGWCHIGNTMIGTLLDDLAAGKSLETVKRRFDEKMNPLQYQRPQALPKAGNVEQAERIIKQLESEGALRRRYATLEDVKDHALWIHWPLVQPNTKISDGVFASVPVRDTSQVRRAPAQQQIPKTTMTWVKFKDTVLPTAQEITAFVPMVVEIGVGVLTASDPSAPPILQWDRDDNRNPVSWYFWAGGQHASNWNLRGDTWTRVNLVTLKPSLWNSVSAHHGNGVLFVLDGMQEKRMAQLCLFPEILKSEYHAVRSTIEAYSRMHAPDNPELGTANGLMFVGDGRHMLTLRVTNQDGMVTEITLDRWD